MKIALRDTLRQLKLRINFLRHRLLVRARFCNPATLTHSAHTHELVGPEELPLPIEFLARSRSYSKFKPARFRNEEVHTCSFATETRIHEAKFVRLAKDRYLDVGNQSLESWPILRRRLVTKPIRRCTALLMPWGHGGASYGDFILKLLPKLARLIETVSAEDRHEIGVCLPYFSSHPWALDYLGLLGIRPTQIFDESTTVLVPAHGKLILGTGPQPGHGISHPQDIRSMVTQLAAASSPAPAKSWRRLYISRKMGRRMANEVALLGGLAERGFEVVHLEELSLQQQITLFREATIIAGPHGAGHANIIWSSPDTTLLEVFHPSWMHPCYAFVSQILGLRYHCLVGYTDKARGAWNEKSRYGIFENPSIDPDCFFKKIDSLIQ